MASEGPESPSTTADNAAVGTDAWSNPNNAQSSDDTYTSSIGGYLTFVDHTVKLLKAGSLVGDNKADTSTQWPITEAYVTHGASDNLWGTTWSSSDINNSGFGVAIAAKDSDDSPISHYLDCSNFGFSIPEGSTIDGITVEIEKKKASLGKPGFQARIDHVRITVEYTEGAAGTNMTVNVDDAHKDVATAYVNVDDAWKEVASAVVNKDDAWKTIF